MQRTLTATLLALVSALLVGCSRHGLGTPGITDRRGHRQGGSKATARVLPVRYAGDLALATRQFAIAMRNPVDFPALAELMHDHPRRYAELMERYNQERRKGNMFGWTGAAMNPEVPHIDYLHGRIEASKEFARKSAIAWQEGWGLTADDVVPKLSVAYPSTRRVAIEFLKLRNDGDGFGFRWELPPDGEQNRAAIAKWQKWVTARGSEHPRSTDAASRSDGRDD